MCCFSQTQTVMKSTRDAGKRTIHHKLIKQTTSPKPKTPLLVIQDENAVGTVTLNSINKTTTKPSERLNVTRRPNKSFDITTPRKGLGQHCSVRLAATAVWKRKRLKEMINLQSRCWSWTKSRPGRQRDFSHPVRCGSRMSATRIRHRERGERTQSEQGERILSRLQLQVQHIKERA